MPFCGMKASIVFFFLGGGGLFEKMTFRVTTKRFSRIFLMVLVDWLGSGHCSFRQCLCFLFQGLAFRCLKVNEFGLFWDCLFFKSFSCFRFV